MKKSLVLLSALLLTAGCLGGCSWWSFLEDEEDNVPVVEENTISSGSGQNSDQEKASEENSGASETGETAGTETEELSEEETPLDTWEALTVLEAYEMTYVEAGEDGQGQYVFASEEDDIELVLVAGNTGTGADLTINEKEYVFAEEDSAYSVSALSVPKVILYDLNGDEAMDIILWVPYSVAVGTAVEQNIYLSGKKGYTALGSMAWNINEKTHAFDYSIELCDEFLVHLSVPDYKIDSWVGMDETFQRQAISLGIYDSEGTVTEYGLEWQETVSQKSPVYQAPFEESIECGINEEGEFVLRAFAPVASGYSGYPLGITLVEDYRITDGAYELSDVQVMENQIYQMLTVDGCLFYLQDKVRGRNVQLVQVTEEGEEEIDVQDVAPGSMDARDYQLASVGELMGYPAFYADYGPWYWRMNFYYGVKDGEVIELGAGWGGNPENVNFLVDVDEDGERELICNVTYGADGARRAYIYYQEDGQVYQGCFYLLEEVENLISTTVGSTSSQYLPEENLIEVTYLVKENGQTVQKTVRYAPTPDNLRADLVNTYPGGKY
ncbi:MAG: hypothetical protein LUH19_00145 [Lachnospiraceae bacterium]|nr:hypothetical protein [Lachnospiraceae bacterium]